MAELASAAPRRSARARRRRVRPGGDAAGRAGGRASAGSSCGWSRCRRGRIRPSWSRASGAEAFATLLEGALSVPEFEVRRVLAGADLDTPAGRDRALERGAPADRAASRANPATRDELVRYVVGPARRARASTSDPARRARPQPRRARPAPRERAPRRRPGSDRRAPTVDAVAIARSARSSRMCVASGELGRRVPRAARRRPLLLGRRSGACATTCSRHFDDPLAGLPEDDPALAALVTEVVACGRGAAGAPESVLRLSLLQLELRRVERGLRHAAADGRLRRARASLRRQREGLRREIDELMGQTA